jgi:hypothetical protein
VNATSRTWVTAVGAAYVLWQLLLPAVIAARPGRAGRDFSWDMFSHHLSCRRLEGRARVPEGAWEMVSFADDFATYAQLTRVLVPGRAELYAHHLCDRLRRQLGRAVELNIITECHADRDGPWTPLIDPAKNYCVGSP